MRTAQYDRATRETDISLRVNLDGTGEAQIDSGVGFLDHMLTLLAFHSGVDIRLTCKGDTCVDAHHTTEDTGIALGRAIDRALGDRLGITRYGSFVLPMDETLVLCALDISGRAYVQCDLELRRDKVGDFDTELLKEFFWGLSRALGLTVHIKQLSGENTHHILEAAFKGFGRALGQAVALDERRLGRVASSKGTLD